MYLFTEPLVTAATHFGKQVPTLVNEAKKGHGPLGRLVFRLHLQKYLSEGSTKLTSQITKVLKPATAFSVGRGGGLDPRHHRDHRHPHLLHHAGGAAACGAASSACSSPPTADRLRRVVDESIRSVTGYMLGNGPDLGDRRDHRRASRWPILGVPFALLLGVFVALVDLLPLVGGLLAGVPVVVIAAIHSVPAGIVMLIVFLVYQQVENHVLNPVIMSKTVRLNPFWVLIAVLVGRHAGRPGRRRAGHLRRRPDRHPGRRCHPGDRARAAPGPRRRGRPVERGTGRPWPAT